VPIGIDIKTRLDAGSMQEAARQAENAFAGAGERAAQEFSRRMQSQAARTGQQFGQQVAQSASASFSQFTEGFMSQRSGPVSTFMAVGKSSGGAFLAGVALALLGNELVGIAGRAAKKVVEGFKSVLDDGIDFSRTINEFRGVTKASEQEMAAMRKLAQDLGSDINLVGTTAASAATAMLELVKGGMSVQDAMDAARGSMQLATAAQLDAAEAARIQSSVLQAFSLDAREAQHVADLLAATVTGAPGDMAGYADALKNVATTAHGFGLSVEEVLATLGAFHSAGLTGAEAGSALNTMLIQLASPSKAAGEAIQEMGLQIRDAEGNFVGMRELLRQIGEAADRMNPAEFQRAMADIFGTRGIRGGMIAAGEGVEKFDALMESFEKTGHAADLAKAQVAGLPGVVEGLSNTLDGIKLEFYDMIEGIANASGDTMVEALDGVLTKIQEYKPELIEFFGAVGQAGVIAAGSISAWMAGLLRAVSVSAGAVAHVLKAVDTVVNAVDTVMSKIPDAALPGWAKALKRGAAEANTALDGLIQRNQEWSSTFGDLSSFMSDLAFDTLPQLSASISEATDKAAADAEMQSERIKLYNEIKDSIELIPETKQVVLNDNSQEVIDRLRDVGIAVESLPDGRIKINVDFDQAQGGALVPVGEAPDVFKRPKPSRGPGVPFTMPDKGRGGDSEPPPYFDPNEWQVDLPIDIGSGAMNFPATAQGVHPDLLRIAQIAEQFGLTMTSGLRPGDTGSFHSTGMAADFAPPGGGVNTDNMLAFAEYLRAEFGPQLAELIYHDPRFSGRQVYRGQPTPDSTYANAGDHTNHVHVAINGPLQFGSGMPGGVQPYFGSTDFGPGGTRVVDPDKVRRAEMDVLSKKEALEEANLRLLEVRAKGNATQRELLAAENDVAQKRRALDESLRNLAEAQQGEWKKLNDKVANTATAVEDQIGAVLDADFGLSKGLAGLAENLVKFIANLAAAPLLGQLSAIKQIGMAQAGLSEPGKGLIGMLAPPIPSGGRGLSLGGALGQISGGGAGFPAVNPNDPASVAAMIYQMARARGYSDHEAQSIVAYALGESGLNPSASGGPQGGTGPEHTVIGLFQQKPAFAMEGGIHPSWRDDPVANTYAYLNQLEKYRHLPIEQALPATSKGGPLTSVGAQPWSPLYSRAGDLIAQGTVHGMGGPMGLLPGVGFSESIPVQPQGRSPGQGVWQPAGSGFGGFGGGLMGMASGALSAAGAGAGVAGAAAGAGPGGAIAGQAAAAGAQMLMELINRTIGFAGQAAGIGVQGVTETFLPNGSALGDLSQNWLFRIAGAMAGAAPQLAVSAGQQEVPMQDITKAIEKGFANVNNGNGSGERGNAPLIGQMNVSSQDNGQQIAADVQRQVNAHGAGMSW